jgi:hypothetical protein
MSFHKAQLPWNNLAVMSTGNLHSRISVDLPAALQMYLPASIEVMFDQSVPERKVVDCVDGLAPFLEGEFARWQMRLQRFIELNLLSEQEIHRFMTEQRAVQPWMLYYSEHGGLGDVGSGTDLSGKAGLIPCSSVPNHGVAWCKDDSGDVTVWLASARRLGSIDWDWDADVGHEVCHASFAPVPLWAQTFVPTEELSLATLRRIDDLDERHVRRLAYIHPEILVAVIRGERRETETGLAGIATREELEAFLEICDKLTPAIGFNITVNKLMSAEDSIIRENDFSEIILEICSFTIKAINASLEIRKALANNLVFIK